MNNWRDYILKEFTPQAAHLTLVADPDGLLLEEGVLQGIRERGFELIPFDDHVAFRYAYESKYRSRWDRGEMTDLVVILRSPAHDLRFLPYDLLAVGRKLSFSLSDLFPNLSYPVVNCLDRSDFEALYQAQESHNPGQSGDNATKDFVLRHVFGIAPELIKRPSDLLRVLLIRHYKGQALPTILDERFIHVVRQSGRFEEWPLERIVRNREAFFGFLQERWPAFLNRAASTGNLVIQEKKGTYDFEYPGPSDIPFEHDDVRVYIDSLFLEGKLRPVACENAHLLSNHWANVGIKADPIRDHERRMDGLVKSISESIPQPEAKHQEWLAFACRWAELIVLWREDGALGQPQLEQRAMELQKMADQAFLIWIQKRYGGLHNQPATPPVMLHHVPRFLAHLLHNSSCRKIGVVVVDGLALDQWIVVREVLKQQCPTLSFEESAIFAWLPTTTSVCRQALFAGRPPIYFPTSISSNNKEMALWSQFWLDRGLVQAEVGYIKGLGETEDLQPVDDLLSSPRVRVAGLVVDKIDKIMHGMKLGTAGMHNQSRQWAQQGFVAKLLDILLDRGFDVFLTFDHGNIEASGFGRPSEGAVADLRGERARVYSDYVLRNQVKKAFPAAIEWPPLGLPDDFLALLAPDRLAFVDAGEKVVAHGGISVEELIVPLVRIERRAK